MWFHESEIVWRYFDVGASFIWAISGALMAATRGYDLTGIATIALVSSTGGGLLRDALFLRTGSVHYGLRTHAARGFVEAPKPEVAQVRARRMNAGASRAGKSGNPRRSGAATGGLA